MTLIVLYTKVDTRRDKLAKVVGDNSPATVVSAEFETQFQLTELPSVL